MADKNIKSILLETRTFAPPADFTARAHVKPQDLQALRARARQDHVGFWSELATRELTWQTPFTVALDDSRPLYNIATAPVVQTAVAAPDVQTVAAPVWSGVGPGLTGQFQCIAGCAGGGPAFVTQNGWELNLVNEIGQPSRAWVDYPGHIWVQSWNEGAVYSADGMTIQFDNGSVWAKNVVLVIPPVR